MPGKREPEIYLRQASDDRLRPQHVVVLLALLAVLYVAGSALLSFLGAR